VYTLGASDIKRKYHNGRSFKREVEYFANKVYTESPLNNLKFGRK